ADRDGWTDPDPHAGQRGQEGPGRDGGQLDAGQHGGGRQGSAAGQAPGRDADDPRQQVRLGDARQAARRGDHAGRGQDAEGDRYEVPRRPEQGPGGEGNLSARRQHTENLPGIGSAAGAAGIVQDGGAG